MILRYTILGFGGKFKKDNEKKNSVTGASNHFGKNMVFEIPQENICLNRNFRLGIFEIFSLIYDNI